MGSITNLSDLTKAQLLIKRQRVQCYRGYCCASETEDDEEMRLLIDAIDHQLYQKFGVLYPADEKLEDSSEATLLVKAHETLTGGNRISKANMVYGTLIGTMFEYCDYSPIVDVLVSDRDEYGYTPIYVYTEDYIYFLEKHTFYQDDPEYHLTAIPRNPNLEDGVFVFGE